jgi:hypothetical protein
MKLKDTKTEKGRRGRPRIIHTQETAPRRVDTQISSQAYQKLIIILERRGITLRDWIESITPPDGRGLNREVQGQLVD